MISPASDRVSIIERYMTSPMSVLSLWQPWASLCVAPDPHHGGRPAKVHETRHWMPRAPLPFAVAIHATKKFDGENREAFTSPRFRDALKRCGFYPGDPRPFLDRKLAPPSGTRPVPLGAIVGVAVVISYGQTEFLGGLRNPTPCFGEHEDDRAFGNYEPGRFAWRLADALMLPKPILFTGRQDALYPVDLDTREAVNAQLRGMVP